MDTAAFVLLQWFLGDKPLTTQATKLKMLYRQCKCILKNCPFGKPPCHNYRFRDPEQLHKQLLKYILALHISQDNLTAMRGLEYQVKCEKGNYTA